MTNETLKKCLNELMYLNILGMFWSSVVFILIKDQIFIFGRVGASSGDFFIAFDMTVIVFDSSLFFFFLPDMTKFSTFMYFQLGTWDHPFCQGVLVLLVITSEC